MNASTPGLAENRAQRSALAECGLRCERALAHAATDLAAGEAERAEEWLERAGWWSDEAFRQVVA